MEVLKIKNLTKRFGQNLVIDGLDLTIPEHSVYGFLGKNGAGKTTTMKMVLGLLKADAGEITACGQPVHYGETKTNRLIGYLPDVPEFYNYMKPCEYLNFCGEISGIEKNRRQQRSEELLQQVGLDGINKKIGGFSRGMKQRLGIAQALLGEPRLLICDEPTSALDPVGRREILDILQQMRSNTTILFSTHILSDAERICDHAAVLHEGKLVIDGTLSTLKENSRPDTVRLEFASETDCRKFAAIAELKTDQKEPVILDVYAQNVEDTYQKILQQLQNLQLVPRKIEISEADLESLFMEVIR